MSQPTVSYSNGRMQLSGNVTPDNVVGVRAAGEEMLSKASDSVIVADLSDLGAAHSVVLSLLLCWIRYAESRRIALQFEGVGERLRSLAALSEIGEYLSGFTAEPAASHS